MELYTATSKGRSQKKSSASKSALCPLALFLIEEAPHPPPRSLRAYQKPQVKVPKLGCERRKSMGGTPRTIVRDSFLFSCKLVLPATKTQLKVSFNYLSSG
ncbi:hypothetical protein CDAR_30051 [Caerostris darwini]|uniref:Uncharacterized protein n=1 Tax=Caerostris darwini TaxID=1538125 RepID=A0AAV4TAL8_9ARAC|nr:hypothetical protein CDAR_30051 [Caerostris darwini]